MRALVTGATGFVGSHMAEHLIAEGFEVSALVRPRKKRSWLDDLPAVERIPGSLEDFASLDRAVRDADYVFHAAGLVKARNEREYFRANADGTRSLLEAVLRSGNKIKRFVQISSQAAVGPANSGTPVNEETPPHPITPYGRSKLAGERAVLEKKDDLPVSIIRPPAVYGPRDRDIFIYFKLASRGIVPLVGSSKRRLSLVHVKDLAAGTAACALSDRTEGGTYFLTSSDQDWAELSETVARAVGRGMRITIPSAVLFVAAFISETAGALIGRAVTLNRHKAKEIVQEAWLCSNKRAREDFGYAPEWDLERGITETAAWYRRKGWIR